MWLNSPNEKQQSWKRTEGSQKKLRSTFFYNRRVSCFPKKASRRVPFCSVFRFIIFFNRRDCGNSFKTSEFDHHPDQHIAYSPYWTPQHCTMSTPIATVIIRMAYNYIHVFRSVSAGRHFVIVSWALANHMTASPCRNVHDLALLLLPRPLRPGQMLSWWRQYRMLPLLLPLGRSAVLSGS